MCDAFAASKRGILIRYTLLTPCLQARTSNMLRLAELGVTQKRPNPSYLALAFVSVVGLVGAVRVLRIRGVAEMFGVVVVVEKLG